MHIRWNAKAERSEAHGPLLQISNERITVLQFMIIGEYTD